ncbi:MAG: methylenetetrahydrofolate reductase [Bdellovibrionia bacterium]
MKSLPFRPDKKLIDVLSSQNFTLSAEIIPPRNGSEQTKILDQIDVLIRSGAQFLAVTKGAGGSLRGGSLPIAQMIKEQFGIPCIAHFTCRDLTPFEVENLLMDHHYFGIRNILALRGDPPDGQTTWQPREGGYNYAHQLIQQIRNLNKGIYLNRPGGPSTVGGEIEKTDFCIGAAAYPEHPNEKERIEFFRLKVENGAEYGMTDMLFDPDAYARFRDLCQKSDVNVPILPGTRFLKTRAQALRMMDKFKVRIPGNILEKLDEKEGPGTMEKGLELFLSLADRLRSLGAPGIHLYVISDTKGASSALTGLASGKK